MIYRRILVPIEHSNEDNVVLKAAFSISNTFTASVTVLHLNSLGQRDPNCIIKEVKAINTSVERDKASSNNLNQINVRSKALNPEEISHAILEESHKYDLIVLGHHRMELLRQTISKSKDEIALNMNECQWLVVPIEKR